MKKKVMALTLAASVMLTGAGYAFWTDKLTIENTITTGELEVKFIGGKTGGRTDDPTRGGYPNDIEWGKYVYTDAYVGKHPDLSQAEKDLISTDVTDKKVTARIGNLYPGSHGWLKVQAQNVGTIPAAFDNAKVTITGDANLQKELVYWINYKVTELDGTEKYKGGDYFTDLSKFEDNLNELLESVILEPDDSLIIGQDEDEAGEGAENSYTFRLPKEVVNEDDVEGKEIKLDIELNWTQHNNPVTYPAEAPAETPDV